MYEGLINNLCKAADKWEKEHPIIGVGQLRVHDALRDAARALKEADSKLEQATLERDAAVADSRTLVKMMLTPMEWHCFFCHNPMKNLEGPIHGCDGNCDIKEGELPTDYDSMIKAIRNWRGVQKETANE